MHTLNEEQQNVKREIQAMRGGDRLVVSGRAGSGKTFAIANSVAERKALFLAPTHQACAVLQQELTAKRHHVATIHRAIGWRQFRDEDANDVDTYKPAKEASRQFADAEGATRAWFPDIDIIVVDEFSMVGSFLFHAVEDYATVFDLPVVYSGDPYQLPPIGDKEVIMDQGFKTITLQESLRFSRNSEIFKLGERLRQTIDTRPNDELPCLYGLADVSVVKVTQWMDDLTAAYKNGDSLLAVASDNATLLHLRGKVRQTDDDRLRAGDIVMSKKTDDLFRNGDELTIQHIAECTHTLNDVPACLSKCGTLELTGFSLAFVERGEVAFILEDPKESKRLARKVRSCLRDRKLNRNQCLRILDWLELPQEFELSALATVHRSQGRSVDTIYIDTDTVAKRPEWLSPVQHKRMLYTAITRARKEVVLYAKQGYCERPKSNVVKLPQPRVILGTEPSLSGLAA
ncbi:ATP-dependent DNA helicase [Loktanella sp. M215]|uniref:ATP-dependent DNA helicase n=1 Tax=Loktanella sp. M215 TaxID=2675431 RepID=UPI001F238729|nr:AAA family ATPase [Loktanella sp. M215]MCF7699215.1 AAA family ATPase [Loktanella sp. M215]